MVKYNWYIVRCQKRIEEKIGENIRHSLKMIGKEDCLKEFKILKKQQIDPKTKKISYINIHPGYLFICAVLDKDVWYCIRQTEFVYGFLGSSGNGTFPIPLTRKELAKFEQQEKELAGSKPEIKTQLKENDQVRILKHPFLEARIGTIATIDKTSGLILIIVPFMGKKHEVTVKYEDVEKI